jgi:hypothetical protein
MSRAALERLGSPGPTRFREETRTPMIMKSALSKEPLWYIVTRYTYKEGINSDGERVRYMVAQRKYDVTQQMEAILKAERAAPR